jgi:hypothetical protein
MAGIRVRCEENFLADHSQPLAAPHQVSQHPILADACMGGQGSEPYEQNTQQSPGLGRRRVPHPVHS